MSSGNRGTNWSADPKDPIQPLNLVVIDKPVLTVCLKIRMPGGGGHKKCLY